MLKYWDKTKTIFAIFFIVGVIILTGCQSGSDVKIGFLIPAGEGYRWPVDQGYVEKAAAEMKVDVVTRSAGNDENIQLKQAKELLDEGVDVLIVVACNSNTAAAIVRDAHEKGVPVIAYDRIIKNCDLDYFVTFEGEQIGKLMVDHAVANRPEGNYVMLYGEASDMNAILIKDAQEAALAPHIASGKINLIYKTFVEDWNSENAYQIMRTILAFSDKTIDAVITSYDGLALGAIRAMEEYGYTGGTIITGQDAELPAIKAVVDGKMSLTVYKSIKTIANAAVSLAVKSARKEKINDVKSTINNGRIDVPSLLLSPIPVDKNNIRSTVIADGFYTEEQVYGSN
jgi:D-xylose transport system substrate-binding protein